MVAGALFKTPFADKFGRRVIIMLCLLLLTIGMLASAFCENLNKLVLTRFFSGLAIGAIMDRIHTVIAKYASDCLKSLAIGIMATSYTSGSVIGGIIYLFLIKQLGWSYVFLLGSAFSCILLPLAFRLLPELLDFYFIKIMPTL
jgi:predicted MFS family arabinose efflux permease